MQTQIETRLAAFDEFATKVCGLKLADFQRDIAAALLDPDGPPEVVALVPRGAGKTSLAGALCLHHLIREPNPFAYSVASSREQAALTFEAARRMARHPAVQKVITARHLELRKHRRDATAAQKREPSGYMRVLAADAEKILGLTPSLVVIDELGSHRDASVYSAMRSALTKRVGAKMLTISTAGVGSDSALGRLRHRALSQPDVRRDGALTIARGPGLVMFEWSVAPDEVEEVGELTDEMIRAANPQPWMSMEAILQEREALSESDFARFRLNQWVSRIGAWLPSGAWQKAADDYTIEEGELIFVGVDVGGSDRSDSAVVWVTEDLRVGVEVFEGEDSITEVAAFVPELATRYRIGEITADPWHAGALVREWEQRGIIVSEFPQHDSRVVPATRRLQDAICDGRLRHPNDPHLNAHVAAAVEKRVRRGARLVRASRSDKIDAAMAMLMAVDRCEHRPEPVRVLGWI